MANHLFAADSSRDIKSRRLESGNHRNATEKAAEQRRHLIPVFYCPAAIYGQNLIFAY
jgi:hypothetical protein